MIRFYALALLGIALALPSKGQVFPQNTMFNYNRFAYNPAVAGSVEDATQMSLLFRQQWAGIPGAPTSYNIAAHRPAKRLGGGVGAVAMNDRIGPYSTVSVGAAYAFHMKFGLDDNIRLNIGVQGGFKQASLNANFKYNDVLDPLLPQGDYSQSSSFLPSVGAGIHFSVLGAGADGKEERFFLGVSGQDLTEPSLSSLFLNGTGAQTIIPRTFFAYTGYRYDFSDRASVQPMLFFRSDGTPGLNKLPFQVDMGAYFNLEPVVLGASYRLNDSFSAIVGADVTSNLFMGYSYDYTVSKLNTGGFVNTHEVMLTYKFPLRGKMLPSIIDPWHN